MPTREELAGALRKADAAGNVEDARRIAGAIRAFDAKAKPAAQTVNPMVAQGQAAQREYEAAGSPELPADNTVRMPAARDPLAPRAGEEWRKIDRSAQPAPQSPFYPKETADRLIAATAEANKAKRENEEYRARRGPVINAISDFLIGGLNAGDQALYSAADAGLNAIDPERRGAKAVRESLLPFAGLRENNDIVRAIPEMAAGIAENPASGAATVVEGMEPTHMIARGGNNLRDAGRAALQGDFKEAQAQYSEATPDLLFGTLGVTPFGSMAVSAAKRGVAAPGEALRAQMGRAAEGFRQFDAPAVVEPPPAQPGPKPAQPGPSGPAPQSAPVAQAPIPQLAPAVAPSVAVQSNLPNGFFQSLAGDGYKHKAGYSPNVGVAIQSNTPSAQTTSYIRKDGGYGDARELNYVDESSLQDVWHPSNDAAKAEAVDLLNRMGGEADNARYKAMQDRLKKVVADDQAGTYAPESPASSAAPVVQPTAPQAPPRPTQPRPASTGQQPNAGNAAPGAGPAPAAAAQPVLNATPAAAQSPIALAKSDAKIIGRLLQAGGVPRNDVNNLLTGLVQAYQGSNSSRLPLAFFAEEYLPTVLPKQTADDVIQKLRGFGRERYSANGPKDTSRSTMRNTVDTLRSSQQENLSGVMDANLYKGKLIGQEDKLNAQLEQNARTAYSTALENASNRLLNGKATQAERDALGEIQSLLHNEAFLKEVPAHLRVKALRDGIKLEDFVQQDPIAAAHWLQSELRQAVTAAEGVGGMATSESRLYGEMRTTLLEQLEKVVPGYRGARKAHGDIYGAKEAIDFGGNFFKSARSEVETARLARQFKAMSTRQKTAATMSIRDALKNEFRNKAEDTAAKVTRLQQAGVLDALETVLGADGKRVADAIRNTVKENERIRAVDMMSGSNTADNLAQMEAAQEAVRSPVNKAIGSLGDNRSWAATLTGDALLAVNGLPPVLTGGKIASSAVGKLGKPSARKLASATKTLYDLPTPGANALASPPRTPRVSGPRAPKPTPEQAQATLDDLLRQYDALDHRANPEAGQKLLRQIDRLKKQLGGPTPNALSTPPRPPVKAGFGGSKQPLPMDEASRMGRAKAWGGGADVVGREQASKYKFQTGKPVVVEGLHGTRGRDIKEFDLDEAGSNFSQDEGTLHFSDSADDANAYATSDTTGMPATDGAVYPVYIRMRNPLVADSEFFKREGMGDIFKNEDRISAWDAYHPFLKERAEELGADGIILKDSFGRSHYISFDPKNIRGKFATFDPTQSGSSKLLAGIGGSEGVGGFGGAVAGGALAPDANNDGVVDAQERAAGAFGGALSGIVGAKAVRAGGNALAKVGKVAEPPPLPLSKENRVFSPGKPDDLGFITSAEYVLANPIARFKDAKNLTPEQWRKFMREGGASSEAFKFQIEPALKRLADEGYTGDIPKAKLEEALARVRGTLSKPPPTRTVTRSRGSTTGRPGTTFEANNEADYNMYVAPGRHDGYKTHVLLLPPHQGQGYKSHNWRSENPVGHIRTTNRTSANGEKVLHVEELQSDLHQEGAKYGYKGDGTSAASASRIAQQADEAGKRYYAWREALPEAERSKAPTGFNRGDLIDSMPDAAGRELYRTANQLWKQAKDLANQPPKAPMENWEEPFIRYALKQGADQGVDVISFPTWNSLHIALKNEGTQKFYDQRLTKTLDRVAKSLGVKIERVQVTEPLEFRAKEYPEGFVVERRNRKSGQWMVDEGFSDRVHSTRASAEAEVAKLSDATTPAIRLTPEAKARLSEGVIMDAKDPGRRGPPKPANALKPAQAGFGFGGGRKPPTEPPSPRPPGERKPTSSDSAYETEMYHLARGPTGKENKYLLASDSPEEYMLRFREGTDLTDPKQGPVATHEQIVKAAKIARAQLRDIFHEKRGLRGLPIDDDMSFEMGAQILRRQGYRVTPTLDETARSVQDFRNKVAEPYAKLQGIEKHKATDYDYKPTRKPVAGNMNIPGDKRPPPKPPQAGLTFGGGKGPPQPQANALASPPKKPRPVEARREAPRGNKPFNNPSLSQGENKISEMLLNGYEYPAIADEMMTSVDVVKQLAKRAQDKLGDAVKLPRPGMGKRPVGSTKREAAFGLFDEGLDNATIAQRTGLSLGNVRTYRSYWKQESGAPVANVNGASYNPPEMPPRPFEADYPQKDWPNGPPVDAQGRLVFDMEGRPLNQNATIVGRSKAPGVGSQSEADRPLRDKTATIQTLRNTGSEFERTPRENLPGQTDGYWNPSYADNGRFTGRGSAVIADDLDRPVMGLDDQELMTIAHELAHNIDFKTNPARSVDDYNARKWGIDPADSPGKAKVNDQLLRIYRDLNNAPGAEAKIGRPLDRGYQQAEEARELWAEAIRAYMWDPNYIKTVAPDVAFMIRHHVNRNSSLRKTIQFNAIPTIVGVGGLGLGAAALNGQPAEAKTRSSGMRANALAPAQNNRP